MLKATSFIFVGQIARLTMTFLRALLLAATLGAEEYGISVILIMCATLFEMLSDVGVDKYIVSDKSGNRRSVQAAIHGIEILRGLLVALGIASLGPQLASMLRASEAGPSMPLMAIPSLFYSLRHTDIKRVQRTMRFREEAICVLVSEAVSFLSVLAMLWLIKDHRIAVLAIVLRSMTFTFASHFLAERSYRVRFSGDTTVKMIRFSAPLLANGLLLFANAQYDKAIVQFVFGMDVLGRYAIMVFVLQSFSSLVLTMLGNSLLPVYGKLYLKCQRMVAESTLLVYSAVAVLYLPLMFFLLIFIVPLVFPGMNAEVMSSADILCVAASFQILRTWCTLFALGTGETKIIVMGNSVRFATMIACVVLFGKAVTLETVCAAMVISELAGGAIAFALVGIGSPQVKSSWLYASCLYLIGLSFLVLLRAGEASPLTGLLIAGLIAIVWIALFWQRFVVSFAKVKSSL